MSLIVREVPPHHADLQLLITSLDEELAVLDGKDHGFYHQFNGLEGVAVAVVAYQEEVPVGCGALKPFANGGMEVKRMFVCPDFRGQGIAQGILDTLVLHARAKSASCLVLETGENQKSAIRLYERYGFQAIPNYGPYVGVSASFCFQFPL